LTAAHTPKLTSITSPYQSFRPVLMITLGLKPRACRLQLDPESARTRRAAMPSPRFSETLVASLGGRTAVVSEFLIDFLHDVAVRVDKG